MKRRLFPQGRVAIRPNSYGYYSSLRLALRKNTSVSFVPLFPSCDTTLRRVGVIFAAGFLAALLSACDTPPAPTLRVAEGTVFPQLLLADLQGVPATTAQFTGKVWVLNVWATWCPPCRKELPSLQRLAQQLDPRHFTVVGMSLDDDAHLLREFLTERKVTFINFQDLDMRVARDVLGVRAYPSTYLISADGIVQRVVEGAQEWDSAEWQQLIRSYAAAREK